MLQIGILAVSTASHYSQGLSVPKPGVDKFHLVIDYCNLNSCTKDASYPISKYRSDVPSHRSKEAEVLWVHGPHSMGTTKHRFLYCPVYSQHSFCSRAYITLPVFLSASKEHHLTFKNKWLLFWWDSFISYVSCILMTF
jgi:hypothetical protein